MSDEFECQFDLLKQEMTTLQDGVKTYDGILFTIRGWVITIFSAFIFFAADKQKPIFLAFCAIAVLLFWLLDSIYKSIQKVYIHRYNDIERFLQSPDFTQAIQERSFGKFIVSNVGASFRVTGKDKLLSILRSGMMIHNGILYISMLILILGIALVI